MKPLKVGLIGANPEGGWARESHVPALGLLPGFELAAVGGKTQQAADAAAHAFRVPKAYGQVADLFADPDIDLVTVAVTLPAHRALLHGALAAGKHVYCEYPLGLDVQESEQLAMEAQAAGVHTAIGLQSRANPAARHARALLAGGRIGRLLTASIVSTTAGFGPSTAAAVAYTEDPATGVNLLTIQTAHTIDLAIALLGGLADLSALASTQFPEVTVDGGLRQKRRTFDHVLLQARLACGAPLAVEVAGGRATSTPFRFEVVGETGTLALVGGAPRGFQSGRLTLLLNDEPQVVDEGELATLPDAALNVGATYARLRADIVAGSRTVTGFTHAVRLARLIGDAAEAARTGLRRAAHDWPSEVLPHDGHDGHDVGSS